MPEFLQQLVAQVKKVWSAFSRTQQIIFVSASGLLVVLLLVVGMWSSRSEYVTLFNKLESGDTNAIIQKLKDAKVEYQLAEEGTAILVPREKVYDIRLQMAGEGLPKGGTVGFEIFEKTGFGMTAFKQKVDYLRALQGELERTISKFAEVSMARVHLVIPEDKLFVEDQKASTASIIVGLEPGASLDYVKIKSIAHLVASSVEGLDPKDITIVDTDMNILSDVLRKAEEQEKLPSEMTVQQEKVRKEWEEYYKHQIESMLYKVLGPNRAVARVFAEIDFDRQEILTEVYKPVVGDEGIVRSTEETEEYYTGTGSLPGGIPGVSSNIPGYQTRENERTKSDYEKRHVIKNYEISKDVITTKKAPGVVNRLSVSVFVDRLTDEMVTSVREVVAAAIGFNQARGDQIVVRTLAFDRSVKEELEKRAGDEELRRQRELLQSMMVLGAFCLFILLVLMVVFKRKGRKSAMVRFKPITEDKVVDDIVKQSIADVAAEAAAAAAAAEAEMEAAAAAEAEAAAAAAAEAVQEPPVDKEEAVLTLAKNNPEEFALLLKTWLLTSRTKD